MSDTRTTRREGEAAPDPPSAELLQRARQGERQALDDLFSRYVPHLMRWAHRRVPSWARNAADTCDFVQDTVLHTLRNLEAFESRHDGALLRYLRRALTNQVRDQFRHAARHPAPAELDAELADAGASPLTLTILREDQLRYRAALAKLRRADRLAVIGRIELQYTYEQLAFLLRKPTAEAARLAVRRAILRLGDEISRRG